MDPNKHPLSMCLVHGMNWDRMGRSPFTTRLVVEHLGQSHPSTRDAGRPHPPESSGRGHPTSSPSSPSSVVARNRSRTKVGEEQAGAKSAGGRPGRKWTGASAMGLILGRRSGSRAREDAGAAAAGEPNQARGQRRHQANRTELEGGDRGGQVEPN